MHNSGLAFNMILQKIRYTPCSSGASWSVGLLRLRQVTFDFCNQSESNVRKTSDTTLKPGVFLNYFYTNLHSTQPSTQVFYRQKKSNRQKTTDCIIFIK